MGNTRVTHCIYKSKDNLGRINHSYKTFVNKPNLWSHILNNLNIPNQTKHEQLTFLGIEVPQHHIPKNLNAGGIFDFSNQHLH